MNKLDIDLTGIEVEDIELFLQEGSRGLPPLAASSSTCDCGTCSNGSCGAGS